MKTVKKSTEAEVKLVVFKLGSVSYAVGIKSVRDVINLSILYRFPTLRTTSRASSTSADTSSAP